VDGDTVHFGIEDDAALLHAPAESEEIGGKIAEQPHLTLNCGFILNRIYQISNFADPRLRLPGFLSKGANSLVRMVFSGRFLNFLHNHYLAVGMELLMKACPPKSPRSSAPNFCNINAKQ